MEPRDANSTRIKPLTKRTKAGDLYMRRPDAELQIEKVLTLEASQIMQMISGSKNRDEADYLLDETLIYLLREAISRAADQTIEIAYLELNRRIWKLLNKFRGQNQADFEDFRQEVGMRILKKLFDLNSDSADFAQVQFGLFVVSEAKAERKGNLVKLGHEQKLFEAGREETDEYDPQQLENLAVNELSAEKRLMIREGLAKLSKEHQIVAEMLLDGFQIESKDASELTISKHLRVSSRTIRNWVKEMRSQLEGFQGAGRR